jgi:phosphotriesterase-related protein
MPSPLLGQVQTVLGPIGAEEIGVTLPHEHLLIDFEVMFVEPTAPRDRERSRAPVSLANLGRVRQNFNPNLDNLRLVDEQVAQDEILPSPTFAP